MSDQEIGKKELEQIELEPFLDAYRTVTGELLSVVESGEDPDFVCERSDGTEVGIELTKIIRDPGDVFWEKILDNKENIDSYEAQELICHLIDKKEGARASRYSIRVEETILVLELVDGSLDGIHDALEGFDEEFKKHEFLEIWLADYSGLEPYGDIELFGLYPRRWRGLHKRPNPGRKPYG